MDALSFEVSVGEERVYDMSSLPESFVMLLRFAGCTSGRDASPVTEVRISESRNDIRRPQTVMSEATNRIEAEVPNEIIQKRAYGKLHTDGGRLAGSIRE